MSAIEPTLAASTIDPELQAIRDALRGLRFGSVNIIVQDGIVVQIDRTEKRRLRKPPADSAQSKYPP